MNAENEAPKLPPRRLLGQSSALANTEEQTISGASRG